eukprot:751376-Hanusia_phi.AAC.1
MISHARTHTQSKEKPGKPRVQPAAQTAGTSDTERLVVTGDRVRRARSELLAAQVLRCIEPLAFH